MSTAKTSANKTTFAADCRIGMTALHVAGRPKNMDTSGNGNGHRTQRATKPAFQLLRQQAADVSSPSMVNTGRGGSNHMPFSGRT